MREQRFLQILNFSTHFYDTVTQMDESLTWGDFLGLERKVSNCKVIITRSANIEQTIHLTNEPSGYYFTIRFIIECSVLTEYTRKYKERQQRHFTG